MRARNGVRAPRSVSFPVSFSFPTLRLLPHVPSPLLPPPPPGGSLPDVARDAQAVVLMVVSSEQAESALFSPTGLLTTLPSDAVVLLCSTVAPDYARSLAARLLRDHRVHLVDAPVSGGVIKAAAGALTIMASGSPTALTSAHPVLDALTKQGGKLYQISGGAGMGSSVKMVNQHLAGVHIAAAAEAMAMGSQLGLDPKEVYEIIKVP